MKILLTGANGQLGNEIKRLRGLTDGHQIIALGRADLDITDISAIQQTFDSYQPDIVINSAAYTQVDKAETEQQAAYAINAQGAGLLANACAAINIPIIHLSTDYVFNGQKSTAYVEEDLAAAINVYGTTKWQGEEQIRRIAAQHIILRVSWIYGFYGHNFVKTMLRLARAREALTIVADQRGCPTAAKEIAVAIQHIIESIANGQQKWGTYHFCNGPATSWYEFAQAIIANARNYESLQVDQIHPITTEDYPTPARRPANSELCCDKFINTFTYQPRSWHEVLPEVIKELYSGA